MAALNKDDEDLKEEIETIKSVYPDQVKILQNPTTIICVIQIDDNYVIQAKFTKPKDEVNITVSNNEKCIERYPRRSLEKIHEELKAICKEEFDAMPIYQSISYLNESFMDDMESMGIEKSNDNNKNKNKNKKNKNKKKEDIKYEEKKNTDDDNKKNDKGLIVIYTWGNKCRKNAPIQSQHNTNVCGVTGYKPKGVNLKQLNGKDERIQQHVQGGKNYHLYSENLKKKIINEGLHTISINCHKGRHRSVAFAELLAKDLRQNYGYKVSVIHLEIS